jgi:hypothetical protein
MRNSRFLVVLALIALLGMAAYAWSLKQRIARSSPVAGHNDSPKDDVLAAYKQMEKAVQAGDGNLYLSLQSQKKLNEVDQQAQEQFRKGFPANPSVRYEVLGVRTRDDHAAVLGKITDPRSTAPQYYLVKFVLEMGSWKIAEDLTDGDPIDTSALDAAVPPKDGAFSRSGSPWNEVPYAATNTERFKKNEINWEMRATMDESFLYIRLEAKAPLPAPGTEIAPEVAKSFRGVPSAPESMVIKTGAGKQFGLQVSDNPLTRATFDENGRAISNRYFMEYLLFLRNAAHEVLFSDGTKDSFDPLIAVEERFVDVKIPLRCLGIDAADSKIEITDANSVPKILSYQVSRFSR